MLLVTQNSTKPFNIYFGVSGLTVTATMSKNGGAFNAVSPTITDRSNGYYSVAPLAAHRDTIGENAWLFAASGQPSLPRVEQVGLADVDIASVGAATATTFNTRIPGVIRTAAEDATAEQNNLKLNDVLEFQDADAGQSESHRIRIVKIV